MDKKIERLIDGTSILNIHKGSEDWAYWKFSKDEIDSNKELKSFLENNKDVTVETLFTKDYPEIKSYVDYNVPLVKLKENEYLVHDSTRIILLNFCIHLLKDDIQLFIEEVYKNYDLKKEGLTEQRFSYLTENETEIDKVLFTKIGHPLALKRLMRRIPHILWYSLDRNFIGLKPLEKARDYSDDAYDYSKLKI